MLEAQNWPSNQCYSPHLPNWAVVFLNSSDYSFNIGPWCVANSAKTSHIVSHTSWDLAFVFSFPSAPPMFILANWDGVKEQSRVARCCKLHLRGILPECVCHLCVSVCHCHKSTDETHLRHIERDQISSLSASMSRPANQLSFPNTNRANDGCFMSTSKWEKKNSGQPSPPPNETPPALPKPAPGSARSLTPQPSVWDFPFESMHSMHVDCSLKFEFWVFGQISATPTCEKNCTNGQKT